MLHLTLRQYGYVVAVAQAGSLTLAAARLNVSQPSLSVAITRVETRLGRPLFERRKGTPIVLTPFGHRFVSQARQVIDAAAALERAASADRPIMIGCFEDIAPWYLARLLGDLKDRFPALRFQGREARFAQLASGLAEGRMDAVVSYDVGFGAQFRRRKLRTVAPVVFLAQDHPLATADAVTLTQVAAYPLILFDEDLSEHHVRRLFTVRKLSPEVAHTTASLELMRAMAAHGIGVGISYSRPPSAISYDGTPVVTVPIADPAARADIALLWSGLGTPEPDLARVLAAIRLP